jgi:hypothetical protein
MTQTTIVRQIGHDMDPDVLVVGAERIVLGGRTIVLSDDHASARLRKFRRFILLLKASTFN